MTDLDLLSPNSLEEAGDTAFTYPTPTIAQATKDNFPLISHRSNSDTNADNNDYWDVKAKEHSVTPSSSTSGIPSPVSRDLSFYPGNSRLPSIDEDQLNSSRHSSTSSVDTSSRQPSFSSTQNLSRGFFTSIRKLRNPSIAKGDYPSSIQDPEVIHEHSDEYEKGDDL